MKATLHKPQAIVTLYTETGNLVARGTNDPNRMMDDDIINIATGRDIGADCPTFAINLTKAKDWHKWVTPNDLVKIEMHRPPEKKEVVFYGLVDDCRKRVALVGDSVERVITITGRGLGKSTIAFDIGIVPETGYSSPDLGWLVANNIELAGSTADKIVKDTWNFLAKEYVNYSWKNNQTLHQLVNLKIEGKKFMRMTTDVDLMDWNGSIWSLLKEVAEQPFYELFWEVCNNKPSLVMRPTPFNKSEWNNLPYTTVSDDEVIVDDLGRSDLETFTLFSVGAKALMMDDDPYATMGVFPYWHEPNVKKYGIRRLHANSIYTSMADGEDVNTVNLMKGMQKDMYNWNVLNNQFFSGTIVARGSNRYKVGQRLIHESKEDKSTLEYYVTAVQHQFSNFDTWTTQLSLTRGMTNSARFAKPVGVYKEFKGMGIEPLSMLKYGYPGVFGPQYDDMGGISTYPGGVIDGSGVVAGAREMLRKGGIRYKFAGPGISKGSADCSQFTEYVYKTYADVTIGRSTGVQVMKGTSVTKAELQPGDLVFFKNTYNSSHIHGVSHVGVYVGNMEFIHLSSSANGIASNKLTESYWEKHWLMGRRVLPVSSGASSTVAQFPMDVINITQGENGRYSHSGKYAIDFVGTHSKYPLYAPFDCTCTIHQPSNALLQWESDGPVMCADGRVREIIFWLIHECNPSKTKGSKVKKGQLIGRTGVCGRVTGDHVHIEVWEKSKGIRGQRLHIYDVFSAQGVKITNGLGYNWRTSTSNLPSSGGSAFQAYEATAYGATLLNLGYTTPGYKPTFKTKMGTTPVEGRTIAVDPKVIPLGSIVEIKSNYKGISGTYVAEDIGGAIKKNKVDIYFDDLPPKNKYEARKRMLAFGRRTVQLRVIRRG